MFKWIKTLFADSTQEVTKEQATRDRMPWVKVIDIHFDPKNPSNGAFELDYNEFFVQSLREAGFEGTTPDEVVGEWFESICKQMLMETHEEVAQMEGKSFIQRKARPDGRTEFS